MPTHHQLPPWLRDAVEGLSAGDVDAWVDLFADDAVHEFPFAAPGAPQRVSGKPAIRAFMNDITGRIRFGSFSDVVVHETGDEVIVEAAGHHHDVETGTPFDLRYVWVITRVAGRITRIRDYMGRRHVPEEAA